MKKLILLFLYACMQQAGAQTTMTLTASQDAAIGYDDGVNPDGSTSNYGSASQNAAFCVPGIDPNGFNKNRALIDFDLTTLPVNAIVTSAKLNLYAYGPIGNYPGHTGANASTLQRITQSWQEYAATWSNQPPATAQNQVTLNASTSATQNYLNIDVTSLVLDMIANPSGSFGFKLQLINEASTNILAFASKDNSNPALHPTLLVTYMLPCSRTLSVTTTQSAYEICTGTSATLTASSGGPASYSWSLGLVPLGQSASIIVSPAATAVYSVMVADGNNHCGTATVQVIVAECTGIPSETINQAAISIYPNPNVGSFVITTGDATIHFDRLELSDLQGRLIKTFLLPSAQTSFEAKNSGLSPGVYSCRVWSGNSTLAVKRLIITN